MIYIVQRNDDKIMIGTTSDLQQKLAELRRRYSNLELLGVIPGDEKDLDNFLQKFQISKTDEFWFSPSSDLLDYLDEIATLDISSLKSSVKYKSSDYTPIKQQALEAALRQQMNLIVHIWEKRAWNHPKPYLYFDLNAGPGITKDQKPGSPVIFRRVAEEYRNNWDNFRYDATFYEADPLTYTQLQKVFNGDPRFEIKNAEHDTLREELEVKRQRTSQKQRDWVFGAVYADPSNAELPWELLEEMNKVYPRVDVMINIACASYKRSVARAGYQTLADRLPQVKKHWIVRKPFGKHQWSILIGTNWPDYPAWEKKDFYPWNKGLGLVIFEKLVYTSEQRHRRIQPPLFELD